MHNRKNSKDYLPFKKWLENERRSEAQASKLAKKWSKDITWKAPTDVSHIFGALTKELGLMSTTASAFYLQISDRQFLQLRRKYGIKPVLQERVADSTHARKNFYARAQLARIPKKVLATYQARSSVHALIVEAKKTAKAVAS